MSTLVPRRQSGALELEPRGRLTQSCTSCRTRNLCGSAQWQLLKREAWLQLLVPNTVHCCRPPPYPFRPSLHDVGEPAYQVLRVLPVLLGHLEERANYSVNASGLSGVLARDVAAPVACMHAPQNFARTPNHILPFQAQAPNRPTAPDVLRPPKQKTERKTKTKPCAWEKL